MTYYLLAIIAFGLMIFFHELGHFLVAKRMGVTVYAFALGFGPPLVSFTRAGTRYAINALPLGGYVRLAGEDLDTSTDPGSFRTRTVWQRMAVVVAGPIMNILLAVALTTTTSLVLGIPTGTSNRIGRLVTGGAVPAPAEAAGLRPGDAIVAIDGVPMTSGEAVVEAIHSTPCRQLMLMIERGGQRFNVAVTSRFDPQRRVCLIGFSPAPTHERVGPVRAVAWGLSTTGQYVVGIVGAVSTLVGNPRELFNQLAGPVGAGKILGEAAQVGVDSYLYTAAVLSVTIGIFNLLPIPALDGGRLLFLAVEAIRRRPVNPRLEAYIHVAGFALLLLLLVTLTWRDIIRTLTGT